MRAMMCAVPVLVALSAGCSEGGAEQVDKNVPLAEKTTIRQFDVTALPLAKAEPCRLISPQVAVELEVASPFGTENGVYPPATGWQQTPTTCYWRYRSSVDVQIHLDDKPDEGVSAVRYVLSQEPVDLIIGYPASISPGGAMGCNVEVAVSDTAFIRLQVSSRHRAGPCALAVRAAQEVLRNAPVV